MRKNVVQMKQIVEKMNLKNLTPDVELSDKAVRFRILTVLHYN